jgi:Tol biopolymer transport system component
LWLAVTVLTVVAAVALWTTRPVLPQLPTVAFQIAAPAGTTLINGSLTLSPDGKYLAFAANGADGTPSIWVRPMASVDARALPGTENAGILRAGGSIVRVTAMVWSPDSRALAFEQQGKLRKIDLATAALQTVCESCGEPSSWGPDGTILTSAGGSIGRIAATGGSFTTIAVPDRSSVHDFQYQYPAFLPDGRHFVFLRDSNDLPTAIFIGSIDSTADRQETLMLRTLLGQTPIAYANAGTAGATGHLLFMQDDVLVAQPFDPGRLMLTGEPVHLVDDVARAGGNTAFFAASLNGTLAFRHGSANRVLVWYGADGRRLRSLDAIQEYTRAEIQLSPDGTRLITTGPFPTIASWLIDLNRDLKMRITAEGGNAHAIWSPDGQRIAFSAPSRNKWALFIKRADGSTKEELVRETDGEVVPNDWSADSHYVLYSAYDSNTKWDLWALPLEGDREPIPIARTTSMEVRGQFSPDGRWIAYESNESGERQIYVRPFGMTGSNDARRSTIDAGAQVRWSRDGKHLFYRRNSALLSVDVISPNFQTGPPKTLFSVNGPGGSDGQNAYYAVSPDGRFLVTSYPEQNLTAPITVLLNWRATLTP